MPPPYTEMEQRNELFGGQGEDIVIDPTAIPLEQQTNRQLVDTAVRTAKDSTALANRALRALEENKQVQAEIGKTLDDQDKQMDRITDHLNEVNQELTYAEKLLRYMRMCCCCFICDSCTGADPEDRRKKDWAKRVEKGQTQARVEQGLREAKARAAANGGTKRPTPGPAVPASQALQGLRDPDVRLPDEYRAEEMTLHEETRKQNEAIDKIYDGLNELLDGAKVIGEKLDTQNKRAEVLGEHLDLTKGRVKDVNQNSQLRNLARGPTPKDDSLVPAMPTRGGMATAAAKRLAGL